jgi:hypothetical protein
MMGVCVPSAPMPVIRFVREGRDVECYPGENLREVALRQSLELYGLKGPVGQLRWVWSVQYLLCFSRR